MKKESGNIDVYENIDRIKFAELIKKAVKEKYKSNRQLADSLGVTEQAVSNWVNGMNMPDIEMVHVICKLLEVNMEYLFLGDKEKFVTSMAKKEIRETYNEDRYEAVAKTVYIEPRLTHEDAVIMYPFLDDLYLLDITSRIIDCNNPNYVNLFFRKKIKSIMNQPAGRHVIRTLRKRCSPLVSDINIELDNSTEFEDAEAYWSLKDEWVRSKREQIYKKLKW